MITSETMGFVQKLTHGRPDWFYHESWWWTAIGLGGNALFGSRFLIQWLHSERHKRLIVPPIFWHLSFWGSIIMLIYGLHLDKVPVILGYVFLPFLYARNLKLMRRSPLTAPASPGENNQAGSSPPPLGQR